PLFPATAQCLAQGDKTSEALIKAALHNTDQRIADDKAVTPAFLYASLLWPVYRLHWQQLENDGTPAWQARQLASQQAIAQQLPVITIPKRYSIPVREIWNLQNNLAQAKGKRALTLLGHARFRAAYDFLLLREQAGEALSRGSQFWTELQAENPAQLHKASGQADSRPRRRRNSGSRRKPAAR
ncbi:MAG: polynucleotide adenylyltransferase PcnB, partial [Pseudomonadales bacterium]|nr:polynucleotide adenylyltransferase PcnB [Pseudomonadales bacterium]